MAEQLKDEYVGMTIPEMKRADPKRTELTLEVWEPGEGGVTIGWGLTRTGLTTKTLGPDKEWVKQLRAPVKTIAYGDIGWGGTLHGLDVWWEGGWREVYYRTPLEREAENAEWLAGHDRMGRERYAEEKHTQDDRFARLPVLFQQRIERRRRNNPAFRMEWESYEGFTCEQAVVFVDNAMMATGAKEYDLSPSGKLPPAAYLHVNRRSKKRKDGEQPHHGWMREGEYLGGEEAARAATEWLEGWATLSTAEKPDRPRLWRGWGPLEMRTKPYDHDAARKLMPGMGKGHSGNTYEMALKLAMLYLNTATGVVEQHGAGAAIGGSEAYGDLPAEDPPVSPDGDTDAALREDMPTGKRI